MNFRLDEFLKNLNQETEFKIVSKTLKMVLTIAPPKHILSGQDYKVIDWDFSKPIPTIYVEH